MIKKEDMIMRSIGGTECPVGTVPVTTEPTLYTVYTVYTVKSDVLEKHN